MEKVAKLYPEPARSYYLTISYFKLGELDKAKSYARNILEPLDGSKMPLRYTAMCESVLDEIEVIEGTEYKNLLPKMHNVTNKLEHGRVGPETQRVQQEIVDELDKLIKEVEDKMNQSDSSSSQENRRQESQMPSMDSKIMQESGPGKVDEKNFAKGKDKWGGLPEKEKIKAAETIARNLPPHFKEAIEGYKSKLAGKDK